MMFGEIAFTVFRLMMIGSALGTVPQKSMETQRLSFVAGEEQLPI
jgi:NADH:ubiquinone oxidoreductase subunit 6 (subunit J)